ncbi:hypothetical protein FQN60_006448, partial [Etheostoma spectabile]
MLQQRPGAAFKAKAPALSARGDRPQKRKRTSWPALHLLLKSSFRVELGPAPQLSPPACEIQGYRVWSHSL